MYQPGSKKTKVYLLFLPRVEFNKWVELYQDWYSACLTTGLPHESIVSFGQTRHANIIVRMSGDPPTACSDYKVRRDSETRKRKKQGREVSVEIKVKVCLSPLLTWLNHRSYKRVGCISLKHTNTLTHIFSLPHP